MRAMAVFPDRQELRIVDVPSPALKREHDVIVRVREVGICGTDREIGLEPPEWAGSFDQPPMLVGGAS